MNQLRGPARAPGRGRRATKRGGRAKLAQKLGQPPALYAAFFLLGCIGQRGVLCIFWATLTPCALEAPEVRGRTSADAMPLLRGVCAKAGGLCVGVAMHGVLGLRAAADVFDQR